MLLANLLVSHSCLHVSVFHFASLYIPALYLPLHPTLQQISPIVQSFTVKLKSVSSSQTCPCCKKLDRKEMEKLLWITTQSQSGFLQADSEVLNTSSVLQQHKAVAARVSCASALSVRCGVLEPSWVWPQRTLYSPFLPRSVHAYWPYLISSLAWIYLYDTLWIVHS